MSYTPLFKVYLVIRLVFLRYFRVRILHRVRGILNLVFAGKIRYGFWLCGISFRKTAIFYLSRYSLFCGICLSCAFCPTLFYVVNNALFVIMRFLYKNLQGLFVFCPLGRLCYRFLYLSFKWTSLFICRVFVYFSSS